MKQKNAKTIQDILVTVGFLAAAVGISELLSSIHNDNNPFAVPLFILAVALTARFTHGYVFGIAASVAGVFCVNYMFTYPFFDFNLTIEGYPLTFAAMLAVSLIISMLTTQIKAQERLRFEAEREKMLVDLLRSVSHDLRTPLTSIQGAVAMLKSGVLDREDQAETVEGIGKDADWLVRITENILSITRCRDGAVELRKTEEILEEVLGSAIVRFLKKNPGVNIAVEKPDEILLVSMDATLIQQVLINLFENAVIHGKTTERIFVNVKADDHAVTVAVADDGEGIDPQILPRIFESYVTRDGGVPADGKRNLGIGLTVCRTIIRAHGGEITAGNRKAGGAEFTFTLPYTPCDLEEVIHEQ